MATNSEERFWELVIKRIDEEKCILIVGPDIVVSETEKSLNERLKEYIESNRGAEVDYYNDDEFFSFKSNSEKEYAIMDLQEFYKGLQANELHYKIAEIPFHLIISISPDHILKNVFTGKKIDHQFAFYNKEQHAVSIQKPSRARPLIYNLFGDIEADGSLIFTYEDLFNYLIPSTGRFELPLELQQEVKNARMVLFIGFKFDKWYFKLLLRLLNLHQDKLNSAAQLKTNAPSLLKNFYAEQFKINFLQYSETRIIDAIHQRCKESNMLRKPGKAVSTESEIFISYAWGGESENIVNEIYKVLTEQGLQVVRDKIALGYKGNIKRFMETIGRGKCVIVVISDKYLKSDNCMYEMLELQRNNDVYNRIFPIILDDANIYDELCRVKYLNYWTTKETELTDAYTSMPDKSGTNGIVDKISLYADIHRIFDQITVMLRDMNTQTLEKHEANSFSELIAAINLQLQRDEKMTSV